MPRRVLRILPKVPYSFRVMSPLGTILSVEYATGMIEGKLMPTREWAYPGTSPISDNQSFFESTIGRQIERHARLRPGHLAMVSRDAGTLSYGELLDIIAAARATLRLAGLGRTARIAVAVSDSRQAALAILSVACSAASIPLSPRLKFEEIESLLIALRPDAIVLVEGSDSDARRAAMKNEIAIIEAWPPRDDSFGFAMIERAAGIKPPDDVEEPDIDAPAFILQTSGTTGKPKLIPFSHRNMVAVAARCQVWFNLTPEDRCLCVTPVAYAHGLKVAVLTPLLTGGTVVFPSDTSRFDHSDWFGALQPTWYSAAPAIHRLVFDRAQVAPEAMKSHSLRFVLSSSAPLPPNVRQVVQDALGVPVIEHYSSSEASFMAANLPRPTSPKPGSVGLPWPDSMIIADDDWRELLPGEQGEILVRGPTVISGYLDAPDITAGSFRDGWFKTGDIGSLDDDGVLAFHGRKSDVINRGGEKISPIEIDEALLRHPDIVDAVAFPVAHPRLGEDVAAAIVLKPGAVARPQDIRQFLRQTLAPHKLPRRIHTLETLPKGNTGKVRRRDLAGIIGNGFADEREHRWESLAEEAIASVWQELLQRKDIGPEDDFFELGGDSLLATQMLHELERQMGSAFPVEILFDNATIRQLASALAGEHLATNQGLLAQIQPDGTDTPLIFIHGDWVDGGLYVVKLARLLGSNRTVYSLQSHGFIGKRVPSIKQMAEEYKRVLDAAGVSGPYCIGGYCNGALTALELARQLERAGQEVRFVALIDAISINTQPAMRQISRIVQAIVNSTARGNDRQRRVESVMSVIWWAYQWLVAEPHPQWSLFRSLAWRATRKARRLVFGGRDATKTGDSAVKAVGENSGDVLEEVYHQRMAGYVPMPVSAPILSIVSEGATRHGECSATGWRNFTSQHDVAIVPGEHQSCITTHIDIIASHLRARLNDAALLEAFDLE
jgi:acyl-CoA synthetase (AMP-forming)/AMP-acid ligase II/thioesterase domain-containing protein